MKRILMVGLAFLVALPAFADLKGDMRKFYGIERVVGATPQPDFVNGVKVNGVSLVTSGLDTVTTGITAHAGGGQASAVALTTVFNNITTCTTAGDSVKLLTAAAGVTQVVKNSGATALAVFPNTSDTINALAANLAIWIQPNSEMTFRAIDATGWETIEVLSLPAPSTLKGSFNFKSADNSGNYAVTLINAAYGQSSTITMPDPGVAAANVCLSEGAATWNGVKTFGSAPVMSGASITAGTIPRASLAEDALKPYEIHTSTWYSYVDAEPLVTAAAADKFSIGGVGVGILGFASKVAVEGVNTTETPVMSTTYRIPPEYVATGDVTVIITAKVTNTAVTGTIDLSAYEIDYTAGTLGADICATAVQTLTTSFVDYSFTITSAGLVAGDGLEFVVTGVVEDAAGGTTTGIQISGIRLACDIKG